MINKKDLVTTKNRKIIYDYIKEYPGIHLNKLFRQFKLSNSSIRHHLKYLVSNNFISVKKEKGYVRYYVNNSVSNQHKKIISHLRVKTTRHILLYLFAEVAASEKELANLLDKADSTIGFHLKKLLDDNIIEIAKVEKNLVHIGYGFGLAKYFKHKVDCREKVYRLRDRYSVYDVFIFYKDKLFDKGDTKSLLDFCNEFFNNKNKVINDFDEGLNNVIDLIESIFPNPICS